MTWNFFYLNMYGKKYIEKAKNTLQGVPKKEFVFQNVQIKRLHELPLCDEFDN